MQEEKISYEEPKTFTLSKYRLAYSIIGFFFIIGVTVYEKVPLLPICIVLFILFTLYLFLPFTYRLIVSDEAISSINLLGVKTLEWNDVYEVKARKDGLLLVNRDGDVKVFINQQIDDYPIVIRFIQQQRPDLWKSDDTRVFHQNIIEETFFGLLGLPITYITILVSLENGFSFSQDILTVLVGLLVGSVLLWQGIKIREITFDIDYLVMKYLLWERRVHISEISSVNLEQQPGKNEISYPVHIKLKSGKQFVIEKVKEGNPILLNAIEMWMETYKGKQND